MEGRSAAFWEEHTFVAIDDVVARARECQGANVQNGLADAV